MEKSEQLIVELRRKIRQNLDLHRVAIRDKRRNERRTGLIDGNSELEDDEEHLTITTDDITRVINVMKQRKCTKVSELFYLSNAFLLSNDNIQHFMKVPGALDLIIGELIINNSETVLWTCDCICNLTLGDVNVCQKIAHSCGNHLMRFLNTSDTESSFNLKLLETTLWTLANLVESGKLTNNMLLSEGLVEKLIGVMNSTSNQSVIKEAYTVMDNLLTYGTETLIIDYVLQIIEFALKNNIEDYMNINIFYKTLYASNYNVNEFELIKIMRYCTTSLNNAIRTNEIHSNSPSELIYKIIQNIRIIANIIAISDNALIKYITSFDNPTALITFFNDVLARKHPTISSEFCWFLGNITNSKNATVLEYLNANNFIENLKLIRFQ